MGLTGSMHTNRSYFSLLLIQFNVNERSVCFFPWISSKCPEFIVLCEGIILTAGSFVSVMYCIGLS